MKKKVYTVTYCSCYDELYTETNVHTDKEKAEEQFLNYVADIHETEGEEFYPEEYKGKTYFSEGYDGHLYLVQLGEQEI